MAFTALIKVLEIPALHSMFNNVSRLTESNAILRDRQTERYKDRETETEKQTDRETETDTEKRRVGRLGRGSEDRKYIEREGKGGRIEKTKERQDNRGRGEREERENVGQNSGPTGFRL